MSAAASRSQSTSRATGLTTAQAAERLSAEGPNTLPADDPRGFLRLIADALREPMLLLLVVAVALYVALGDVREALLLSAAVVLVLAITVFQQGRTERVLRTLRGLSSPRAQVLRDGQVVTLPARELVRGDVIRVAEGDRVPADATLRSGTALQVDESLLTGESVAVVKVPEGDCVEPQEPGGSSLLLGSLVVAGSGVAEVARTGARTELGKIGASLSSLAPLPTPLQREVRALVQRMAVLGLGVAALIVLLAGLHDGQWVKAVLAGVTAAMTLLPEEFPVALAVFLALGARRLAQHSVLTRTPSAVEALGGVHYLCTDKTGTLTQNRMAVRVLRTADTRLELAHDPLPRELPESVHLLLETGILACPRDPFDPTEKAFHELGNRALADTEHLHPELSSARQYPLTPELLAVTHLWRTPDQSGLVVATKGAPEAVLELCHLPEAQLVAWRQRVDELADAGLRVLGVARGRGLVTEHPVHPHDLDFELLGLVGLYDPLQPGVAEAVQQCRDAQIRVLMITGDHPTTAQAIAREAGIDAERVLSGGELATMSDAQLGEALLRTSVLARALPEHKLRVVRALQARGITVGMTGDGVNDAPALKAADVGIAMGARGTAVAREAADIVLTDDNFRSIVHGVRLGRRIYDNLRKAFRYILAVHVPIAGTALLPVLLGHSPLLLPAHVIFLELVIDPACSVVFESEPEEPDVMRRRPRPARGALLPPRGLFASLAQGLAALLGVLSVLWVAHAAGEPPAVLRTLAFVGLIASNLAILIANRSTHQPFWVSLRRANASAFVLISMAAATSATVVLVPFARELFGFAPAPLARVTTAMLVSAVPVLALDLGKLRRAAQ